MADELKNFAFFEAEQLTNVSDFLRHLEFTCSTVGFITSESVRYFFGDAEGYLWVLDKTPTMSLTPRFFIAHSGPISFIAQVPKKNLLVTVGPDVGGSSDEPVVKLWDMNLLSFTPGPPCHILRPFTLGKFPVPPARPVPTNCNPKLRIKLKGNPIEVPDQRVISPPSSTVTALHTSDDGSGLVLGITTEEVILIRGDLEKDRNPKIKKLTPRFMAKGGGQPATLKSVHIVKSTPLGMYFIYGVYSTSVVLWRCALKGDSVEDSVMYEGHGFTMQAAATTSTGVLIVGTEDSIHFFGGEDKFKEYVRSQWDVKVLRVGALRVPYEKKLIWTMREYIGLVLSPDPEGRPDKFLVYLCEKLGTHALRVFSTKDATNVAAVLPDASEFLLMCQEPKTPDTDYKVTLVSEKDMHSKLDIVIRREDFHVAIALSHKYGYDFETKADVHRRYGDFLFDKGSYDEAIHEYVMTIGSLEPSYVIRKFLHPQQIRQLSKYVEQLHNESHVAVCTPEHTTLLLTCLARLRMTDKLTRFIESPNLHFDVDTAIAVCLRAGYYDQAVVLAKRVNGHGWYVKILLERTDCEDGGGGSAAGIGVGGDAAKLLHASKSLSVGPEQPEDPAHRRIEGVPYPWSIRIIVVRARDLIAADANGFSDPYVKVEQCGTVVFTTPYIDKTLNPEYDPEKSFCDIRCKTAVDTVVNFTVWDHDVIGSDDFLGQHQFQFHTVEFCEGTMEAPLVQRADESDKSVLEAKGALGKLTIHYKIQSEEEAKEEAKRSNMVMKRNETMLQNYRDALEYVRLLPLDVAQELLKEHAKTLISKLPVETTMAVMELCTEWGVGGGKAEAHQFIHCFVDTPRFLLQFLECVCGQEQTGPEYGIRMVHLNLLELYLTPKLTTYRCGMEESSVFLDDVAQRQTKALAFLKGKGGKFDEDAALVLVRHYGFEDGELYLLRKLGRYAEILQHYIEVYLKTHVMEEREILMDKMHSTCVEFGETIPSMWVTMFLFLVDSTDDMSSITLVLAEIQRRHLLPPLVVMDIVGASPHIQLDTIKDYVVSMLSFEMAEIDTDQTQLQATYREVVKVRHEIRELMTSATVFQSNKCAACGKQLELPTIHFLCKHSFHTRCLTSLKDCNLCSGNHRPKIDLKEDLASRVDDHESFFNDMMDVSPENRYLDWIVKEFGKTIFNGQYKPPEFTPPDE